MTEPKRRRGRPPKKKRARTQAVDDSKEPVSQTNDRSDSEDEDPEVRKWDPHSGLKPSALDGADSDDETPIRSEMTKKQMESFRDALMDVLVDEEEDDPRDQDWLTPAALRKLRARKTGEL